MLNLKDNFTIILSIFMDSDYYLQFLLSLQASITHLFYTASMECFGNTHRQL